MTTIALTEVTGKLGGSVVRYVDQKGMTTRHLARRPATAPHYDTAEVVLKQATRIQQRAELRLLALMFYLWYLVQKILIVCSSTKILSMRLRKLVSNISFTRHFTVRVQRPPLPYLATTGKQRPTSKKKVLPTLSCVIIFTRISLLIC